MNVYRRSIATTIVIFLIGLTIGMLIDNFRISEIKRGFSESEIIWEDTRLLNIYIEKLGGEQCQAAFEENLAYNNRIYEFGKEIEKRIEASTFTPEAEQEWNKYVLLQFQFWLNSIELKEKCDFDYSNVVYISRRKEISSAEEMNSKLQSATLLEIKEKCGRSMMLIPLTADSDLESINLVLRHHNITKFPAIIIDERYVLQGLTPSATIERYINC